MSANGGGLAHRAWAGASAGGGARLCAVAPAGKLCQPGTGPALRQRRQLSPAIELGATLHPRPQP